MKKQYSAANSKHELFEKALERERKARIKAEDLLDSRTVMLNHINQKMALQYENVNRRNKEIMYFNSISQVISVELDQAKILYSYMQFTANLTGWKSAQMITFKEKGENSHSVNLKNENQEYEDVLSLFQSEVLANINDYSKNLIEKKIMIVQREYFECEHNFFIIPLIVKNEIQTMFYFRVNSAIDESHPIIDLILNGIQLLKSFFEKEKMQAELKLNISILKEAQRQLVQSEKMASLGVISAGVAHEINNPICFILTNIETMIKYTENFKSMIELYRENITSEQVLKKEKEFDLNYILEDTPALLAETLDGIHRVKDIVSGLKAFSHLDEEEYNLASINDCLEQSLKLTWNELKYKCNVHKNLENIPDIYCYSGQLVQVFTNLFINSSHAVSEGGNLFIDTSYDSNRIYIKIRDDGIGIPEENIKNIFTPFFTTKPTGQGTGLGLSISYGIIQKHNGNIEVNSKVGVGTEFIITLPRICHDFIAR